MFCHSFVYDMCFLLVCKNTFSVTTGALACLFFCPAYYYSMVAQSIIDCVPSFYGHCQVLWWPCGAVGIYIYGGCT